MAIRLFAEDTLQMDGNRVYKDGAALDTPMTLHYEESNSE